MLQSFGDKVKGSKVLGYFIIGIITVPFALFGIQSYIGAGSDTYAAKVNDVEISLPELDRETQNQRQRLAENFGGKLPKAFDSTDLFKNQALQVLIKNAVLNQYLNDYHFSISDADLSSQILSDKMFLKDGKFDQTFYKAQIASLGYSVPQFEEMVRDYARSKQIQKGFMVSNFILADENKRIAQLKNQKRNLTLYIFNKDNYKADTVLDNEIQEYYNEHKNEFVHPKKFKLSYIELKVNDVADAIHVTDDELMELYEANKAQYKNKEKRTASHILIKVKASDDEQTKKQALDKILSIKKEIQQGLKFSEAAKKYSQDIGSKSLGGQLGDVEKGIMVKPFEDALFAMKKGEISNPVLSTFGYHIIKLMDIKTPTIKSFAELKPKLEKELKLKKADTQFYELSETIANQSYENSDNLEAASEASGIKIKHSNWLTASSNEGIYANPLVKNAISSDQVSVERLNSDLIELEDNHVVVVRLDEVEASKNKTLDEVKEEIKTLISNKNIKDLMNYDANILIESLKSGSPLTALKYSKEEKGLVSRQDSNIDRRILNTLFKLHIKNGELSVSSPVVLTDKLAVISSNKVVIDAQAPTDNNEDIRQAQTLGAYQYEHWLEALKEKSEIIINKTALE